MRMKHHLLPINWLGDCPFLLIISQHLIERNMPHSFGFMRSPMSTLHKLLSSHLVLCSESHWRILPFSRLANLLGKTTMWNWLEFRARLFGRPRRGRGSAGWERYSSAVWLHVNQVGKSWRVLSLMIWCLRTPPVQKSFESKGGILAARKGITIREYLSRKTAAHLVHQQYWGLLNMAWGKWKANELLQEHLMAI